MNKIKNIKSERPKSTFPIPFTIKIDTENAKQELKNTKDKYIKTENIYKKANKKGDNCLLKLDDEIDKLNDRITELISHNYELDQEIQKEYELKTKYEIEQKRRTKECNDIKNNFNNYFATINSYKKAINDLIEDNNKLQDEYETKINEINLTNDYVFKQLNEKLNILNIKREESATAEKKINDILKEISNQRDYYNQRAEINSKKYFELEKKFTELQNKIMGEEMSKDLKNEEVSKNKKLETGNIKQKNELQKQIKQLEKNNEIMSKEIGMLKKQYRRLVNSTSHKRTNKRKKK